MKYQLIKAFFEYGYLDEIDINYLKNEDIKVEEWYKNDELEQRICLEGLDDKQKEKVKEFMCSKHHKYINEFSYVIFYK